MPGNCDRRMRMLPDMTTLGVSGFTIRRFPLLCFAFLLAGCASSSREPSPNLSILKGDCVAWHDSGAYDQAVARAAAPARKTLDRYLRGVTPQNFAIVF